MNPIKIKAQKETNKNKELTSMKKPKGWPKTGPNQNQNDANSIKVKE